MTDTAPEPGSEPEPDTGPVSAGKHVFEIATRNRFANGDWWGPAMYVMAEGYDLREALDDAKSKPLSEWVGFGGDDDTPLPPMIVGAVLATLTQVAEVFEDLASRREAGTPGQMFAEASREIVLRIHEATEKITTDQRSTFDRLRLTVPPPEERDA
jgi:hypothetical protein